MHLPDLFHADEMEREANASLAAFVSARSKEGTREYEKAFKEAKQRVKALFDATNQLADFSGKVLAAHPELIEASRFLGGPPLSQDDLDTLSGGPVTNRKTINERKAGQVVEALRPFLDPFRCPWLQRDSPPRKTEVRTAIYWTSSLWAVEKCRTSRRTGSSKRQEAFVDRLLSSTGLRKNTDIRKIGALDDLARNQYTREVNLGGAKADLAVRCEDGRLIAIECKVSNSAINSVKRLNRESGGKADRWRRAYGEQVVTAAVLSGVYKLGSLMDAQSGGVHIFWEHDLERLRRFVEAVCAVPET